jgi:hydrogenase expression/formation protein HypE
VIYKSYKEQNLLPSSQTDNDYIILAHGSGGALSQSLTQKIFLARFDNQVLSQLDDSAVLNLTSNRVAFTTDTYVVDPLFFPGGDIGKLAVCGTINDLSVQGAIPRYLSVGFILEEGFSVSDLKRIVDSMAKTAREAGVEIVAGDTKVVQRDAADKIFINTAGIGEVRYGVNVSSANVQTGDAVVVTGTLGDHGISVLVAREQLGLSSELQSDVAPLNGLIDEVFKATQKVHTMRDPTRGGLAATLNEIAHQSAVDIEIEEGAVPVNEAVAGACELLGFDPLYIANEGKAVVFIPADDAQTVIDHLHAHPLGRDAAIIGTVRQGLGRVYMKTRVGGSRIIDMPVGEQLPRIC